MDPLYQLVEQYWPDFQTQLSETGRFLPWHATREFEDYLACGRLEEGFLRVRCEDCSHEHQPGLFMKPPDSSSFPFPIANPAQLEIQSVLRRAAQALSQNPLQKKGLVEESGVS